MDKSCEMCLMLMKEDPGNSGSDRYCSHCFSDGAFRYTGNSLWKFQLRCYRGMREKGFNLPVAIFNAWTIRFAPYWKEKKRGSR